MQHQFSLHCRRSFLSSFNLLSHGRLIQSPINHPEIFDTNQSTQINTMWRSYLQRSLSTMSPATRRNLNLSPMYPLSAMRRLSSAVGDNKEKKRVVARAVGVRGGGDGEVSVGEVKKLLRLVNVEALKTNLGGEGKEVIGYSELLQACESMGVAKSIDDAAAFARVLDEAGVVLLFRDKVYLHPDKVVDLVRRSVPLALTPEDDPRREELKRLQEQKEIIDKRAHKQVRAMLWGGLGLGLAQIGLFFRLTFWDFSWDVMEPIAFFTTSTGIIIGYAFFMFTSKDLSYVDLMQILFLSRQRKLFKKYNFDVNKFKELTDRCKLPLEKKKVDGSLAL